MKLFKNRSRFFLSMLLVSVFSAMSIQALAEDDDDDDEGENWRVVRRELQQKADVAIKERLDREVSERVALEAFAKQYNQPKLRPWSYPVMRPKLEKEELDEDLMAAIEAEIKVKFPEEVRNTFPAEAEAKYRMWKKNDDVEFIVREGVGMDVVVTGKLIEATPERVKVYPRRTVNVMDLNDETKARLYPSYHEEQVAEYIRAKNRQYDTKINGYRLDQYEKRLPEELLKNGYVPNLFEVLDTNGTVNKRKLEIRLESSKLEHWVSRYDLVHDYYLKMRALAEPKIREEEERKVFLAAGYIFVKPGTFAKLLDTHMADELQGWMPADVRDELAEELAQQTPEQGGEAAESDEEY